MLSARVGAAVLVLVSLAACDAPKPPGVKPDPDFSSIRSVAWTNTAQELAGFPASSDATNAQIYGFGDSGLGGPTSVASGGLVLSGVSTERTVIIAAQSAKTGEIVWRRRLPTTADGYAECDDDEGGPVFGCKVVTGRKDAKLWIIADRTGAVRKKIPVDPGSSVGVSADDLYLATFKPANKDQRLEVSVERRAWGDGRTAWKRKTSFAIDGWGHDGGSGFLIGKQRVVAYSASWQVVLDRATGRLLDRADQGRWEHELANGERLVVDSGDGTRERVDVTVFAADGRPVAEVSEATYPDPYEIAGDRVVIGRHILSKATGRIDFTAPKRHVIVAVADRGRVAIAEPVEFDYDKNRLPLAVYNATSGKHVGAVELKGNWSGETLGSGNGVVKVMQHYKDETDKSPPPTVEVIDVRKPRVVATLRMAKKPGDYNPPTLVSTPYGVAVTGAGAVRGLVAR